MGKGQVSLEILLLASVIIFFSLAVFSYYNQVRDSTVGMQAAKVETLRQIDEVPGLYTMESLEYTINIALGEVTFCIFTNPRAGFTLDTAAVENAIEGNTGFKEVTVVHNPDPSLC